VIPATQLERPLRADARRNHERIIASAKAVFAQYGIEAQMDDVAERAQVGVGTVYRHFPTKEALMAELVRQKFQQMVDAVREGLAREGEPFELLADTLRRNAEQCADDAAMQHALSAVGEHIWNEAAPVQAELYALTEQLIERARRAGSIRTDIAASDIAMVMCGVSSTMNHHGPGFDWRRHLELVIDMLRAPQGGSVV
jgi:AcrR family transcriptional regulator